MITTTDTVARVAEVLADPRWAAVRARDRDADGRFVYAVRSTGVYCRPSCGARTPRPENVAFYPDSAAAAAAGFRPCLRCTPDQASPAERHAALVAGLCRSIEAAATPPTLAQLAAEAKLSPSHLQRVFKAVTGLSPHAYAAAHRAQRLRAELAGGTSATEAIYAAGYGSAGQVYGEAAALLGMRPGEYRRGARGLRIAYALARCSLGELLVATTARGVCAIFLGDTAEALLAQLRAAFPGAELSAGGADFAALLAQVVALVEHPGLAHAPLPLDLRGTALQLRVWQALREILPGTTLSYAELAARVGAPRAVRAVASACAANLVAVAVPCHRALRGDGSLAGYRWGLPRKAALLAREKDEPGVPE